MVSVNYYHLSETRRNFLSLICEGMLDFFNEIGFSKLSNRNIKLTIFYQKLFEIKFIQFNKNTQGINHWFDNFVCSNLHVSNIFALLGYSLGCIHLLRQVFFNFFEPQLSDLLYEGIFFLVLAVRISWPP